MSNNPEQKEYPLFKTGIKRTIIFQHFLETYLPFRDAGDFSKEIMNKLQSLVRSNTVVKYVDFTFPRPGKGYAIRDNNISIEKQQKLESLRSLKDGCWVNAPMESQISVRKRILSGDIKQPKINPVSSLKKKYNPRNKLSAKSNYNKTISKAEKLYNDILRKTGDHNKAFDPYNEMITKASKDYEDSVRENPIEVTKVLLGKDYKEYRIKSSPIAGFRLNDLIIYAQSQKDFDKFRSQLSKWLLTEHTFKKPIVKIEEPKFISFPPMPKYVPSPKYVSKPEQTEAELHKEILESITKEVPKCNDYNRRQAYVFAKAELYMMQDSKLTKREAIDRAYEYFINHCRN